MPLLSYFRPAKSDKNAPLSNSKPMRKINLTAIPEKEKKSPKGKYQSYMKEVSVALGREPSSLNLMRRHPFDLAVVRIPPGATLCPYHAHSAQWELYVVMAGVGSVRHENGVSEVSAGDAFLFGPGEAHQIANPGKEDLVYQVMADNPFGATCYYPDSKKWLVGQPSEWIILKGSETDYLDGEE
jgi:uncharacterized cupin superfamily protein